MSSQLLFDSTIEPDEPSAPIGNISSTNNASSRPREQVVLTPSNNATALASNHSDAESGIAGIFRQSSHPLSLFFLYIFRLGAVVVYIFSGFFTSNYVLSTVLVVVLLAVDFWTCRNVSGRTLVGLRFWNQVDDDGESYWVFESRDPSRPANPIDSRMFWIALYAFPVIWVGLLFVAILKFNASFVPIVLLALVFNVTNVIGFTYADRDARQKWAQNSGWGLSSLGGFGGQLVAGAVKNSVSRVFG
ncbi:Golgi apparatus membrane protein TVP23 [Flagelloscypha sp. PMI_526]|nr:Golgi apparatus membrane protein TVP23 [Flagelloscypha sp. PMI_526]